jgi:hypothetical protein
MQRSLKLYLIVLLVSNGHFSSFLLDVLVPIGTKEKWLHKTIDCSFKTCWTRLSISICNDSHFNVARRFFIGKYGGRIVMMPGFCSNFQLLVNYSHFSFVPMGTIEYNFDCITTLHWLNLNDSSKSSTFHQGNFQWGLN